MKQHACSDEYKNIDVQTSHCNSVLQGGLNEGMKSCKQLKRCIVPCLDNL